MVGWPGITHEIESVSEVSDPIVPHLPAVKTVASKPKKRGSRTGGDRMSEYSLGSRRNPSRAEADILSGRKELGSLGGRLGRAGRSQKQKPSPTSHKRQLALSKVPLTEHPDLLGAKPPCRGVRSVQGDLNCWDFPSYAVPVHNGVPPPMNHCAHQISPPSDRVTLRHDRDGESNRGAGRTGLPEARSLRAHTTPIRELGREGSVVTVASRQQRIANERLPRRELNYDLQTDLEHHVSVSHTSQRLYEAEQAGRRTHEGIVHPEVEQSDSTEATNRWVRHVGRRMSSLRGPPITVAGPTLPVQASVPHQAPIPPKPQQATVLPPWAPSLPMQGKATRERTGSLPLRPPSACLDVQGSESEIVGAEGYQTTSRHQPVVQQAPSSYVATTVQTAVPSEPSPCNRAKLRKFAGDGTEKWQSYDIHFRAVSAANCWDDELAKVMLMTALAGSALRHLESIPSLNGISLQGLQLSLQQEFGRPEPRMSLLAQLNSRVQGPNETFHELSRSIRELVQRAFPHYAKAYQEDTACIRFCEAIREQDTVGFHVRHLGQNASLQDLVDEAELVSRIKLRPGHRQQSRLSAVNAVTGSGTPLETVPEGTEQDGETGIADLIARMQSVEARQIASFDARTCYNCRKKGHISYDCPEPKRDRGKTGKPKDVPNGQKKNKKGKSAGSSSDGDGNSKAKKDGESGAASGRKSTATQTSKPTGTPPGNGE